MVGAQRAAPGGAPFPDCGVATAIAKGRPAIGRAGPAWQGYVGPQPRQAPLWAGGTKSKQSQRRWDPKATSDDTRAPLKRFMSSTQGPIQDDWQIRHSQSRTHLIYSNI